MKEKIFINARIIDPSQNMDEKGSLVLNDNGKVKAIGKNVKETNANKDAEVIDLKGNVLKYMWRYEYKNGTQDLEKAQWYLNKLVETCKKDKTSQKNL